MISDPLDQLQRMIDELDVEELIRAFDIGFDLPFRHAELLGLLDMKGAFAPVAPADDRALSLRVGAFWCRIVSDDVRLDLPRALSSIGESREDAIRLQRMPGEFAGYAAARWADGAGKVLYRTGSHARARILFEDACLVAEVQDLWWCLPDLRSNYLRAEFEEARLAGDPTPARVERSVANLRAAVTDHEAVAARHAVSLDDGSGPVRHREFRRGYLSLLHNLSIALQQAGDLRASGAAAQLATRLAVRTQDEYRRAQALLQQVQLARAVADTPEAAVRELLTELGSLRWERGRRIAAQQLAVLDGGEQGITGLLGLMRGSGEDEPAPSAGLDVEFEAYAASHALRLATQLQGAPGAAWLAEVRRVQLGAARSVRQVIALPAYKRAYSRTVRPVYLAELRRLVEVASDATTSESEHWEETLSLVEESAGRELLDLMSSARLPRLGPPVPTVARSGRDPVGPGQAGGVGEPGVGEPKTSGSGSRGAGRRSRPRRAGGTAMGDGDRLALLEREQEFESQFLRNPLQAAAHDPEIARRAEGFVINNAGSCIVRYFGYDPGPGGAPDRLGAFVIRDGIRRPVDCGELSEVRTLVEGLLDIERPSITHAEDIWRLLLAPLWSQIAPGGVEPSQLVVVPSDELFAVPFHIAVPTADAVPLGARLPLSHSVSLAAFLLRGRDRLRRQRVQVDDDLAALILQDFDADTGRFEVSGAEVVRARWDARHLHLAGDVPADLHGVAPCRADWDGLSAIAAPRPEFFVYAGHGRYVPDYRELGPFLEINDSNGDPDRLTPYDVALRLRLPRNRLTVLGACLAGQGAQTAGGDVAGFLRAFIAAGAGAIALPLWEVTDDSTVATAGHLLRASRDAVGSDGNGVFDVVATLQSYYRSRVELASVSWIDELPFVLYT